MTIRLRPHHLLCMLTYAGTGYSRAFTVNFDAIAAQISRGAVIAIVSGPDDICAPLLDQPDPHCLRDSVRERDTLAARDLGELLGTKVVESQHLALGAPALNIMREAFASGGTRHACLGCEWHSACTHLASAGFLGTRLGSGQ
jgi:hypothetical protein